MASYFIEALEVTGEQGNAETVLFDGLIDKDGNAVPATLTNPWVGHATPFGVDRAANIVTTIDTQFEIAMSDFIGKEVANYYYNLEIVGTP